MIRRRAAPAASAALALAFLACTSMGPSGSSACAGLLPPRILVAAPATLPSMYVQARIGGEVTDQIVIDRGGAVRDVQLIHTTFYSLAPAAEASLQRSRFAPASLEGNPVSVRAVITTPVGILGPTLKAQLPYSSLWAYVPGGESREARWQLRDSVRRLTLVAHIGAPAPGGAEIVALAPDGSEHVLAALPASSSARDFHETVKVGPLLKSAGDYRLQVRESGRAIASTTLTIADDHMQAIVNACEPIAPQNKTGPEN